MATIPSFANWESSHDYWARGASRGIAEETGVEPETRSGLSKQSQGIDANALQNRSATAVAQVFSASQMRVKLIARIMAEGARYLCPAAPRPGKFLMVVHHV